MKIQLIVFFLIFSINGVSQNSLASRSSEYSVPILFDFNRSVKQSTFGFTYEVTQAELYLKHLGRINDQTFSVKLLNDKGLRLEVSLPSALFEEFDIQLINRSGQSLIAKRFSKADLAKFPMETTPGKTSRFVIDEVSNIIQKMMAEKEPVKLCVAQTKDKFFTRLCSRNFGVVDRNGSKEIKFEANPDSNLRALIENEPAPLKGTAVLGINKAIRAFFEFQGGTVFELINQPKEIEFIEIVQNENVFNFFGVGTLPFGAVKRERQSDNILKNLIPFDATIGDLRDYYDLSTPASDLSPVIIVGGQAGGLFQYYLDLIRVPKESERMFFRNGTPNSTYEDQYKIYVSSDKAVKFSSSDVKITDQNNQFIWTPTLAKKGQFNKATLDYEKEGIVNRAYLEVYRGFSQEFSLKLTGISMADGFVPLGEVSYNNWFESLGTKPGSLFYQRLGVGLSFFKSLSEIKVNDEGAKSNLESTNVSLKYRFTPGLWNWDESWGALISYQNLNYQSIKAPLAGVGFFWARSMPQIFDRLFNLVPIFRYPKWVDLDYTYFPSSLDSNIKIKDNMVLNFHGKILWTKRVYGEAGFGYKIYNIESAEFGTEIRSLYLTLGLGLNF